MGDSEAGAGVTIGIIDSALGPPPTVASRFELREPREYTALSDRDPTDHGTWVFGAMCQFAKGATFRFYRLLGDGCTHHTDLLEPIADAATDEVDVLNISAGYGHEDGGNRVRTAIETEMERSNLQVVAAAGNVEEDPDEPVTYPARFEDVIAVGGFEPRCDGTVADPRSDARLWIDTSHRPGFPPKQGPLCNHLGCDGSSGCSDRTDVWWEQNLRPVAGKPDILAPVYHLTRDEHGPLFVPGTSFAAPVVSGLLAALFAEADRLPPPVQTRRLVRNTGVPIDDGSGKKFCARLVRSRLG